jgi:hypothetical protein
MSRWLFAIALAGVAAASACSLLTNLDDLRGSDGAVSEGGSDASAEASIACEAGLTACGASCVDTTSEPTSCGACGRDCQGQPCANGLCAPVTIAQVPGNPHGIAVGNDAVYFTTYDTTGGDGGIFRVSTDGGGLAQIASAQNYPSIIALVDGGGLYWTNAGYGVPGTIMYAERDGGSQTKVVTASGSAFGLALTSTSMVWTNSDKAGSVEAAALDGGGQTTIVPNRNTPSLVATDGVDVYWGEQSGSVMKSAIDGTNVVTLAGNLSSVFGVAIDQTDVYFSDQTAGLIGKVAKNGGSLANLATGQEDARCVAVDKGDAFWAAYANGAVRGYVGGQQRNYATNQNAPLCVALDASWVYWTDYGDGTIKKTPR